MVQLLIANGARKNLADSDKNTPLHLACAEDRGEVALFLVKNGADADRRNKVGRLEVFGSACFRRSSWLTNPFSWSFLRLFPAPGREAGYRAGQCFSPAQDFARGDRRRILAFSQA